ncbi:MAG: type II secretion system protein N [Gammaproteobacteria bacterium]
MKKKHYIFIAIASYFIFLIATIPAKPVIDLVNSNTPVNLQGVSGTLWNGKAYMVTINDNTTFKNTSWSFTFWKLFIGQVAADIHSRYLGNDIDTEIGSSFLGKYFVNDLSTKISAKDVVQIANIPLVQLEGLISINIDHAQWKRGELPIATGIINWNNATITVADTISLGNISITMSESEQESLTADIKNQGGDITVAGTAELVPEADYAVDIKLSPTASTNNNIKQSLGLFAKRQTNGTYLFKKSGPLNQIGLM